VSTQNLLWQVQVLPDACRSLPFSGLGFSFNNPGGRELRERKKEKRKKNNRLAGAI
jgi:hypothetical protein